jgi:hypothetical protein
MKSLLPAAVIFFCSLVIKAQTNAPLMLPLMTQEEIDQLKPQNGMMIFNITQNAITYYSNGSWYLMSGECAPKPRSPEIDSFVVKDDKVLIYFHPVQPGFSYIFLKDMQALPEEIYSSPATFKLKDFKGKEIYMSIRSKNRCGASSPSQPFRILIGD